MCHKNKFSKENMKKDSNSMAMKEILMEYTLEAIITVFDRDMVCSNGIMVKYLREIGKMG